MRWGILAIATFLLGGIAQSESSLTFGGATSHLANYGSGATIDSLDPMTIMFWIYPTTFTGSRVIFRKTGTNQRFLRNELTAGRQNALVARSVSSADRISVSSMTLNQWNFIAMQYNSAGVSGSILTIYISTGNANVMQAQYSGAGAGDGSGTSNDDSGDLIVGNNSAATQSWRGSIGPFTYVNKALTTDEMTEWMLYPTKVFSETKLLALQGFNGTGTQSDLTGNGNSGTVTGATASLLGPPVTIF